MDLNHFCKDNNIPVEKLGPIGEVSDGYHTFNSLYYQRMVLFAALVNTYPNRAWKSHRHNDGEVPFGGGWFIVGIETPQGNYTYHYEDGEWELFHCKELEKAPEWDGHTDLDVDRLLSLMSQRNEVENAIKAVSEMDSQSGVAQSVYVIEECSELIKELMKQRRGKSCEKDIVAEACDVLTTVFVMLMQCGVTADFVKDQILYKCSRAIERYRNNGEV